MSNDIEAGRAFVTLYVRDRAFRQQLADNEQLYQQSLSAPVGGQSENPQLDQLAGSIDGYQTLEQTADASLETVYNDTTYLAEETERLNEALQAVMSSYEDLAGMQEEGITLAIGGPGGGGGGFDEEGWLDTAEIEHTLEGGALTGISEKLGGQAMAAMMKSKAGAIASEVGGKLRDKLLGQLKNGASQAIDSIGDQAMGAGQRLLTAPTGGGAAAVAKNLLPAPSMGSIAVATKGADVVMAELVPAAKGAEVVMAEIVPTATAATTATAGLGASLAALAPVATAVAVAAAVLVPVLAAIDEATGGSLSESGYYPEWLKKIGDVMLLFGPIGPVIQIVVAVFKELWAIVKELYEAFTNFAPIIMGPVKLAFSAFTAIVSTAIKVAFFPLHAALFALNAPFRAVHLAVDTAKQVFALAHVAVVKFVEGVKSLPGVLASAVAGMGRLAASAASAAANMASSTWDAAMSSIHAVSNGLQTAGKSMAIVGAGMAALGATIVAPLTKAAETFANHGKEVSEIAEKYEISAEAAATYAYMASQTGKSVKDLTKVVKEGSEEFAQWNQIAYAAGWTIGDSASTAVALAQAYKEVKDALHGLWTQLGRAVAPMVEESTKLFAGAVRAVALWVRNNQELIATAFRVASTIAAVGSALATAGGVLISVGAAISPFTVALAGVAGGLAIIEYKTKAGATLWGSYKDSLVNVFGTVMSYIKPMVDEVQKVVQGIKDAVLGNDIDLAFTIVVEEIKAVWAGGLAWLAEQTGGIFGDILANLGAGRWQAAADGAMGMLTAAFWRANQVIDDVWEGIKSTAASVWSAMQDGFDVALTAIEVSWLRLVDKVKETAAEMLKFLANNVFGPMAKAMGDSMLTAHLKGAVLSAQSALMDAAGKVTMSREKDLQQQIDDLEEESLDRRAKRHEEEQESQNQRDEAAVGRWIDRRDAASAAEQQGRSPDRALSRSDQAAAKELTADWQKDVDRLWETAAKKAERMTTMENNPAVYSAEKQSQAAREWEEAHRRATEEDKRLAAFKADVESRMGPVAQAQAGKDAAEQARDEAIEKARIAREAMTAPDKPDDPEKAKKHSGFLTTSAYAFGQFGSSDPQRSQLEEMKKRRQEAIDERKQRDKDWAELLRWQKILGTRNPEDTRLMFDLLS